MRARSASGLYFCTREPKKKREEYLWNTVRGPSASVFTFVLEEEKKKEIEYLCGRLEPLPPQPWRAQVFPQVFFY